MLALSLSPSLSLSFSPCVLGLGLKVLRGKGRGGGGEGGGAIAVMTHNLVELAASAMFCLVAEESKVQYPSSLTLRVVTGPLVWALQWDPLHTPLHTL